MERVSQLVNLHGCEARGKARQWSLLLGFSDQRNRDSKGSQHKIWRWGSVVFQATWETQTAPTQAKSSLLKHQLGACPDLCLSERPGGTTQGSVEGFHLSTQH